MRPGHPFTSGSEITPRSKNVHVLPVVGAAVFLKCLLAGNGSRRLSSTAPCLCTELLFSGGTFHPLRRGRPSLRCFLHMQSALSIMHVCLCIGLIDY